jgi:3-isopropylmalate dehydrogenase
VTEARYRIATIPGDGVGPDVTAAARRVVDAAGAAFGFSVDWSEFLVGGAAIDAHGVAIRPEDVAACGAADAILLGAVGGPKWSDPSAAVRPEQALFALRGGLGLYANLRPVSVHPALIAASPLRPELLAGVDILIVRELTGGIYFGARREPSGAPGERSAEDTLPYAEAEVRRVVELAFSLAARRRGHVTSVDKANVLATSRLWRTVASEIGASRPDVTLAHQLVDSCAMLLVRRPADFDVIVTENLFGDILSDEAAVLAGSLGMLPSASLGERRTAHGTFGLYEPIHGSAPDIAGRDLANPIGTILSAAMLLRLSLGREDAAAAVEAAVSATLDDGHRTADLLPPSGDETGLRRVGTTGITDAIVERIAIPEAARATAAAPS